jgi:DNA-dependent RNA polymerase auxiliary subunit epsilon
MPSLKATRLQHVQDIFSGKKKVLLQKDVPARSVPNWPQLAVKVIYHQALRMHPDLKDYLPDPTGNKENERLPERDFFYKVFYKLHPETVDSLILQATEERKPKEDALSDRAWHVRISDNWMDELLRYEYKSSKLVVSSFFH